MEDELLVPVRLSREGFGGTPEQIANMRTDFVLAALEFSHFQNDFEETFNQLNKDAKP